MSAAVSLGRDYRSILDQKISEGSRSAAAVIEAIHRDAPTDQIAKASSFRFRQAESFGVEIVDRESTYGYSISDHALNQAAERAGIPAAYVRELARTAGDEAAWKPELAAQIMNQHFGHSEGRILARSVR